MIKLFKFLFKILILCLFLFNKVIFFVWVIKCVCVWWKLFLSVVSRAIIGSSRGAMDRKTLVMMICDVKSVSGWE